MRDHTVLAIPADFQHHIDTVRFYLVRIRCVRDGTDGSLMRDGGVGLFRGELMGTGLQGEVGIRATALSSPAGALPRFGEVTFEGGRRDTRS